MANWSIALLPGQATLNEASPTLRDLWGEEVLAFVYDRMAAEWTAQSRRRESVEAIVGTLSRQSSDLRHLATLAHVFRRGGFVEFVEKHLSGELPHVAKTRVPRYETNYGGARGRIDWARTFRRRIATANPALLETTRQQTSYDTSENRVLAAYLDAAARSATAHVTSGGYLGQRSELAVQRTRSAQANVYLRDVTISRSPKAFERQRARRHRLSIYQDAARLLDEIQDAVDRVELSSVISILRDGWLRPLLDDDVFEVLVLVRTLSVLEDIVCKRKDGEMRLRPISYADPAVGEFVSPIVTIRAYYDRSPHTAIGGFGPTDYTQTQFLRWYEGINGSARRPDLLVEIIRSDGRTFRLLVEAKNTSANTRYARDSLYKVLGYISDFSKLWPNEQANPKALLVMRDGLECIAPKRALGESVVLTGLDGFRASLSDVLDGFLGKSPEPSNA